MLKVVASFAVLVAVECVSCSSADGTCDEQVPAMSLLQATSVENMNEQLMNAQADSDALAKQAAKAEAHEGLQEAMKAQAASDALAKQAVKAEAQEGLCQARAYVAGSTILMIGDSQADAAGPQSTEGLAQATDTLGAACGGKSVTNRGCGGSKASEWIANNGDWIKTAVGTNPPWTHVWISLGGNDQCEQICPKTTATNNMPASCQGFGPRCSTGETNMKEIRRRLNATVQHVKALAPNAKIVFTGYAVTGMDDSCPSEAINKGSVAVQKELAKGDSMVKFASIGKAACGETDVTKRRAAGCSVASPQKQPPCFGDGKYFRGHSSTPAAEKTAGDFFHLNAAGYERAWKAPDVQAAFDCTPLATAPSDCPAPGTPAPTASPCPGSTESKNTDDDTGIAAAAASAGAPQYKKCDHVRSLCCHPTHGSAIRSFCCCPTCPSSHGSVGSK